MANRGSKHVEDVRRLHAQRLCDVAIAGELGLAKSTVRRIRHRLDLPAFSPSGLTPWELAALIESEIELYVRHELTMDEISERLARGGLERSSEQIRKDLLAAGVELRPSGARRIYPKPEERECARAHDPDRPPTCKGRFTPKGAQVAKGWGSYCSDPCWLTSPEHRELTKQRVKARHALARAKFDRMKGLFDLLEVKDLAGEDWWDTSPQTISKHYVLLGLKSKRWKIDGCYFHAIKRAEAERFEKEWLRTGDSRRLKCRLWYLEPKNYVAFLRATGKLARVAAGLGVSEKDAEGIAWMQAKRRSARFKRHRRGRKAGAGPPAHYIEAANRWREIWADLNERYAVYHVDGDRPPSKTSVAYLVAVEDFEEHPERHSYDPRDFPIEAGRKFWGAIKPLLNAVSEINAA